MTDRPIIMSAAMVNAILREIEAPGTGKTMTRRLLSSPLAKCEPGDRLWLREKHWAVEREGQGIGIPHLIYDDEWDGGFPDETAPLRPCGLEFGPRPSIHMYRWASRLTLHVTEVRREKLRFISDADARAEGVTNPYAGWAFAELWDSLHRKPGTRWGDNPEVVAIGFRPVLGNIDSLEAAA